MAACLSPDPRAKRQSQAHICFLKVLKAQCTSCQHKPFLIFMIIIITLKQNNAKPWIRNATVLVNLVVSPCHISEVAN